MKWRVCLPCLGKETDTGIIPQPSSSVNLIIDSAFSR